MMNTSHNAPGLKSCERPAMPWFCLMGPTASGKTALAIELTRHFPFEIISIDSAMIYRGMNIGSAKPDPLLLSQTRHHLIDILDPIDTYSVAQCRQDVIACGTEIRARGKIPLLVGGTMLYFRALQQGLAELPEANPTIRQMLSQWMQSEGLTALYIELTQCDPESAARIHPHDAQRIMRALEVYRVSGKPLSHWLRAHSVADSDRHYVNLLLMPENRAWLHERIADRFSTMLEQGLVEEVEILCQQWPLTQEHPAMRCVGYRQVWHYLYHHRDAARLRAEGIAATRQLAKRQLTWLRHWPNGHTWMAENKNIQHEMIAFIERIAHNGSVLISD